MADALPGSITAQPREELDLSSPLFDALTLDAAREISSLRAQLAAERAVTASVRTALGFACADVVELGARVRDVVARAEIAEGRAHGLEQTIAGLRIDVEGLGDARDRALATAEAFAERMEAERVESDDVARLLQRERDHSDSLAQIAGAAEVGRDAALARADASDRALAEERERAATNEAALIAREVAALGRALAAEALAKKATNEAAACRADADGVARQYWQEQAAARAAEARVKVLEDEHSAMARDLANVSRTARDAGMELAELRRGVEGLARTASSHAYDWREAATCAAPEIAAEQREAAEVFDALAAFARSLLSAPVPPAEGAGPAPRLLSGDALKDAMRRLSPPPAIDDYEDAPMEEPASPPPDAAREYPNSARDADRPKCGTCGQAKMIGGLSCGCPSPRATDAKEDRHG